MRNRRIIWHVTLKNMLANRKRAAISFISISLMVLLITCVFVGRDTVIRYFTETTEADRGKWHLTFYDIDKKEYEDILDQPFAGESALTRNAYYTEYEGNRSETQPYLNVRYYSAAAFDWMNIEVTEGRLPENSQEIILSESVKANSSIQTGDTVSADFFRIYVENISDGLIMYPFQKFILEPGQTAEAESDLPWTGNNPSVHEKKEYTGEKKDFTVTGFMKAPMYETSAAASLSAIAFSEEVPESGTFNLMVRYGSDNSNMFSWLRENFQGRYNINNYVTVFSASSGNETMNFLIAGFQIFLVVLILIISIILMDNIFTLSYEERVRYLGMLASIGATGKQKRSSVWFEACVLLAFALPVGILGGFAVIRLVTSSLTSAASAFIGAGANSNVPVHLDIHVGSLLLVIVCSVITVLVSALKPARKIAAIGPVESMRGNDDEKAGRPHAMTSKDQISPEAMLAKGFLRRERKKSAGIRRAVMSFVIVLATAAYSASAIIQMAEKKLNENETGIETKAMAEYDYALLSNESFSFMEEVKDELTATGGVVSSQSQANNHWFAEVDGNVYSEHYRQTKKEIYDLYYDAPLSESEYYEMFEKTSGWFINLIAVEDDQFRAMLEESGSIAADDDSVQTLLYNHGALSTDSLGVYGRTARTYRYEEINDMTSLKAGDTMRVLFPQERHMDWKVAGTLSAKQAEKWFSYSSNDLYAAVSWTDFEKIMAEIPDANAECTWFFNIDETNQEAVSLVKQLKNSSDEILTLMETDIASPVTLQNTLRTMIRIILTAFAVFAGAVCFLNVFNCISSLMSARRKTDAVLRSLGMSSSQMNRMKNMELSAAAFAGILEGLAAAAVLCWLVKTLLISRFGSFTVEVPYILLAGAIGAAVLMVLLSGWYTSFRESRISLIEQIRRESI